MSSCSPLTAPEEAALQALTSFRHGFTAESYKESPAEDVIPILLPWGDDRKARYQFRGDEYSRQ